MLTIKEQSGIVFFCHNASQRTEYRLLTGCESPHSISCQPVASSKKTLQATAQRDITVN